MSWKDTLNYRFNVGLFGPAALKIRRWKSELQAHSKNKWKSDVLAPPLKIDPWNKELISLHYLKGNYANIQHKVAWVTSGAPVERPFPVELTAFFRDLTGGDRAAGAPAGRFPE